MNRLARAVALGALQGPTELLPVSSSAHLEIASGVIGAPFESPSDRKAFEVALHAGAAGALAICERRALAGALRGFDRRRAGMLAAASIPPAIVGAFGREMIERRLSRPGPRAAGLAVGGLAMAIADRAPAERGPGESTARDGLWLGVAQASALAPGVSRNGATLAAARMRGFDRAHAARLSWGVALPVVAGAIGLKAPALTATLSEPRARGALVAGTAAAAASTALSHRLLGPADRPRRLWPFAVYRLALAAVTARSG